MSCSAVSVAHDPRTPEARYILWTRTGMRAVELCRACADSYMAMGMALTPDRRTGPRAAGTAGRRPAWVRRALAHELPAKEFRP